MWNWARRLGDGVVILSGNLLQDFSVFLAACFFLGWPELRYTRVIEAEDWCGIVRGLEMGFMGLPYGGIYWYFFCFLACR